MKKLILTIAVLVGFPHPAVPVDSDKIPGSETIPESELVRVVTGRGRALDCMAPVIVNRIDGEPRAVPSKGFTIEPGVHTLNGRAVLDTTYCKVEHGGSRGGNAQDLEVNFELGKIYYIGYDYRSLNRDEWKLVVWRVEELPEPDV